MEDASVHQARQKDPMTSTQLYLRIAEIHDDIVVLKSGGLRAVLEVNSVNIALKSEDEQNALNNGYQRFLNSLEFPIQIVTRSRKMDATDYLNKFAELEKSHESQLMKRQVAEYVEYIRKLVEVADVMEKKFFVVVPYDPVRASGLTFGQKFWNFIHPADSVTEFHHRQKEFKDISRSLLQRLESARSGLENCGLITRQLTTPELIQMFYEVYNPLTARNERADDFTNFDWVNQEELPLPGTPA